MKRAGSFFWASVLIMEFCSTTCVAGADLVTEATSLFSGSGTCAFCHDQWGGALLDSKGESVSITEDWRGTMMANSFKDPLWRAVMETEVAEHPELKAFIEDKCQTCHAPMARTQHQHENEAGLSFENSLEAGLASDGVSCTLCHQIQAENLGKPESFTGNYVIKSARQIFGPYHDVLTMPMLRHVDYRPQFGAQVQDSSLCGTCHTLHTPVLGKGNHHGIEQFPEQTPYLEWRASDFAREGKHCQDCHMERLDEPIKMSARPPWLGAREPFWRHEFVGGNAFMLQMLRARSKVIQPNGTAENFEALITRAREQLQRAARLEVRGFREGTVLRLEVQVANLTGHKFPTGHPYRRAWLHVQVRDARGRKVFESGAVDKSGGLAGMTDSYAPHYDKIMRPEQVQVYESVMGNAAGARTYGLLSAVKYLKDNRIPPRGSQADAATADVAVHGKAATDPNFNTAGDGTDKVCYQIELGPEKGPFEANVALRYQAVPPESVARLASATGIEARTFTRFYRRADKTPETVHTVTSRIE